MDQLSPDDLPLPGLGDPISNRPELPFQVIRSAKRRKTSAARLVDGRIEIRVPAWLSAEDEADVVADLVARVHRAHAVAGGRATDLAPRARQLAATHGLPEPDDIRWVTNQNRRWGSCSPGSRTVRISSRLRSVPDYVLDAVIVHELAHLVVPHHSPAFRALEARYPRLERAEGFLEAMGLGCAADEFTEI